MLGLTVRAIGKLMQFSGLGLLPVFVVLELSGALGRGSGVAELLLAMIFGVALFYLGRIIEGYAGG